MGVNVAADGGDWGDFGDLAEDLRVAVQATAHDRARGNGRADLDCAAIADALNGSQP